MNHQIQLKALEAYTRDIGKNIARIDEKAMNALGASAGDVVKVEGSHKTISKCLPLYPSDEGKGIARVDGLIRKNAGISIGDTMTISKIGQLPVEKLVVAPITRRSVANALFPSVDSDPNPKYLVEILSGMAVATGDMVMMPYLGMWIDLIVLEIQPSNANIVNTNTIVELLPSVI